MDFAEWEPVYEAILADFGFDRVGDVAARDELAELTTPFDDERLAALEGSSVAIVGAGPSLEAADERERARDGDAIVAASTAADTLLANDIAVDCVVTDLDKHPATVVELTHSGVPVAVHAHGDNRALVRDVVPDCAPEFVLPTTQARPVGPVVNCGGFTDGDRAAFLADAAGATRLSFVGWDLEDESVDPMKRRKLAWAERLLAWLEHRRGERFALLEGRRDRIEPVPTRD